MSLDQLLKYLGFSLYPFAFFLYSPFKEFQIVFAVSFFVDSCRPRMEIANILLEKLQSKDNNFVLTISRILISQP